MLWGLWGVYGVYMAMSEGVGKAYISNLVVQEHRAMAIGLFYTVTGVVTFFSSMIAGLLWQSLGASSPFYFGGLLAVVAGVVFFFSSRRS
jgi:membrane protein insertase Oxa1/YidC/SpoIIIJ